MREDQYYNLAASGVRAGYEGQKNAEAFLKVIMARHLRNDHGYKMHEICKELDMKMKEVKEAIND